jgi:hypothetical protein
MPKLGRHFAQNPEQLVNKAIAVRGILKNISPFNPTTTKVMKGTRCIGP